MSLHSILSKVNMQHGGATRHIIGRYLYTKCKTRYLHSNRLRRTLIAHFLPVCFSHVNISIGSADYLLVITV